MKDRLLQKIIQCTQHYNHKKYWKDRQILIDKDNKINLLFIQTFTI